MRIRTLLLACTAALAFAGAASAQSLGPGPGNGAVPPLRIAEMVRAAGFQPLFRPMRQGDTYVLRALDRNEIEYRLVIDAHTGRTMSIRETGEPGPYAHVYRGGPTYRPYGAAPMYGRTFGPNDDGSDSRYGAPPQLRAPQTTRATPPAQPKPTQLATPEPNKTSETPLPRPRPYVMEATSSIPADAPRAVPPTPPPPAPAPVAQNPTPAVAPSAPAADTPHDNGGASMPPVTPLD